MKQKKNGTSLGLIGGVGLASILALAAISSSNFAADTQTQTATVVNAVATSSNNSATYIATSSVTATEQTTASEHKPVTTQSTHDDLSNNNTYTNVSGHHVHAPAYDLDGDVPVGASARCRDGTYSFSQNHRGTCSHHGGVNT